VAIKPKAMIKPPIQPFMFNTPLQFNPSYLQEQKLNISGVQRKQNTQFRIIKGDITKLKIECIVNASNHKGTSFCPIADHCINSAIHAAAGPELLVACKKLNGIPTTMAKITPGFNLQSKWIIHVAGPKKDETSGICDYSKLRQSYINVLNLANENGIKQIGFCCISTGISGFNKQESADTAINTVRLWLQNPRQKHDFEHIVFSVFTEEDLVIYSRLLQWYQNTGFLGSIQDHQKLKKEQEEREQKKRIEELRDATKLT
jgi:O-acetyl-ADP-ribose deacetylase (regulator of RNase III)